MPSTAPTVLAGLAGALLAAAPAAADPITVTFDAEVSEAANLAFAVINGELTFSFPQASQLPLTGPSGTLVFDPDDASVSFEVGGSVSGPGFAVTYDFGNTVPEEAIAVWTDDAIEIDTTGLGVPIDLQIAIDLTTGTGTFDWTSIGTVPTSPPQDRFAIGTISGAVIEGQEPDPVFGDIDSSGSVDFGDIALLLFLWGTTSQQGDLDLDGIVGFGDLLVILENWGN